MPENVLKNMQERRKSIKSEKVFSEYNQRFIDSRDIWDYYRRIMKNARESRKISQKWLKARKLLESSKNPSEEILLKEEELIMRLQDLRNSNYHKNQVVESNCFNIVYSYFINNNIKFNQLSDLRIKYSNIKFGSVDVLNNIDNMLDEIVSDFFNLYYSVVKY